MSSRAWPLLVALAGCTSTPPLPPPSSDVCADACDRRRALGCLEEGLEAVCVPICQKSAARGLYDPRCPARAIDREAMAACGVRCAP
jgi:hypothetical protein